MIARIAFQRRARGIPTVEASRNGGYIVRGLRMALRDRWVLEIITVTITPVNASQTKVALTFEIREQY